VPLGLIQNDVGADQATGGAAIPIGRRLVHFVWRIIRMKDGCALSGA
jgi:hypothetical protein